jgi:LmbE family N-acetylglucosaminyl deacetylase
MKLPESILILAPHPDDEVLMAAGVIRRALTQGLRVSVCVVSNGDYLCPDKSKGVRRLTESLEALSLLGLDEENVYFLGYPDTGMETELSFLYKLYGEEDALRVFPSLCGRESYGIPGRKPDFRFERRGRHSPYYKAAFLEDLRDVITLTRPQLIITSSQWDVHGDHAGLFYFVRDAISAMPDNKRPELWESLIHSPAGDDIWPLPDAPFDAFSCPPGFDPALWDKRISVPVPGEMLSGEPQTHLKYRAIAAYRSAVSFIEEPEVARYLLSFAKTDEVFWRYAF